MTLHPWPLTETTPRQDRSVLWAGAETRGLLTDSPAVPLRFAAEATSPNAPPGGAAEVPLQARYAAALLRIRELEARLNFGR